MATSLNGANQKTEWYDLRGVASNVDFLLTGNFSTPIGIHYSNLEEYDKEAGFTIGATTSIWPVSAAAGPFELPFGLARFVRFFSTGSWGGGTTCTPSFGPAKNADGQLVDIAVQDRYAL